MELSLEFKLDIYLLIPKGDGIHNYAFEVILQMAVYFILVRQFNVSVAHFFA